MTYLVFVFVVTFLVFHQKPHDLLLLAHVCFERRQLNFDVSTEINVVSHLGQKNCSEMSWSGDLEKCSISFVNIFKIAVKDEVASGYREPLIVLRLIVLNFIVCRNKFVPFLNLIELVFGTFRVVGLGKHPSKVDKADDKKSHTDVLI